MKIWLNIKKSQNIMKMIVGEIFEEYLRRSLFLVKLQAYNLHLDWKMSAFAGVFKDFA